MSLKNDKYGPLNALGLPAAELNRAKARIRSRKLTFQERGLDEDQAMGLAVAAEVDRLKHGSSEIEIPPPPEGSGLVARGVAVPRDGQHPLHWSFTIYDVSIKDEDGNFGKKRRVRFEELDPDTVRKFPDGIEETIALKRRMEESQAGIMQRIERQNLWLAQNREHLALVDEFVAEEDQKRKENNRRTRTGCERSALRTIFDFYLNPKENYYLPNVYQWSEYFKKFRAHLVSRPILRRSAKGKTLSKNSQKNIISTLNRYLAFVWEKGDYSGSPPKCKNYKKKDLERRGIESLISPEEEKEFISYFNGRGLTKVAAYMKIANHIAGRPSEMLGISLLDIKPGAIPADTTSDAVVALRKSLETIAIKKGLTVYGYVIIRGQVDEQSRREDGTLGYYPPKTKDSVEPENYRYCPVVDEEVWKAITGLARDQRSAYSTRKYGPQLENYLLFDGLNLDDLQKYFREFRTKVPKWGENKHTPHCCRHTACAYWVMLSEGDLDAAQRVLGHADWKETEHYSHLAKKFAEVMQNLLAQAQGDDFFEQFV